MKRCKAKYCDEKAFVKNWCINHYYYAERNGKDKAYSHRVVPYNIKNKTCSYNGCNRKHYSKGYCSKHYARIDAILRGNYRPCLFQDGRSAHPLHGTWYKMIDRCYNKKLKQHKDWGGRGIKVCEEWLNDFWAFVNDMSPRLSLEHSIDRINNNGNYDKDNCRWATRIQQANNKRRTNELTAKNVADAAGYSAERVRQLTRHTTSSPGTSIFPLKDYIDKKIGASYIYRPEAIKYLINRRQGT